jgi:hypothetical protein
MPASAGMTGKNGLRHSLLRGNDETAHSETFYDPIKVDGVVKSRFFSFDVIPAKAGI